MLLSWTLESCELFELIVRDKCMSKPASLEEIVKQFEIGGLAVVMTTPPKTVKFPGCTSIKQSLWHRGDHPKMEPCKEVPVTLTLVYLNPRASGVQDIQLTKNAKYPIPLPPMSKDVIEEGALLGHIQNLKYQDYNLQDPKKFPRFQVGQYMCKRTDPITQADVFVPQEWIERLAPSGLLNLLWIPHFRQSPELNAMIKVLLSCMHNGYFWLDKKIDMNVDAIHLITNLSKVGTNPSMHFIGKNLDRKLATKLTKEFNLSKGTRSYDVTDI